MLTNDIMIGTIVSDVKFVNNIVVQQSTKFTPFSPSYGRQSHLLIHSVLNVAPSYYIINLEDYANEVTMPPSFAWH